MDRAASIYSTPLPERASGFVDARQVLAQDAEWSARVERRLEAVGSRQASCVPESRHAVRQRGRGQFSSFLQKHLRNIETGAGDLTDLTTASQRRERMTSIATPHSARAASSMERHASHPRTSRQTFVQTPRKGLQTAQACAALAEAPLVHVFTRFDAVIYSKTQGSQSNVGQADVELCSICLREFRHGQWLKRAPCPGCHVFHESCAKRWFQDHGSCPVCRADLR
eukprot:TRINITY_DN6261_c0_g1_i1.p1 TRINITY_DN6261_c0_g1~~TRINITY_DN6261_c0_g1_i1.p1  ORF type:complete len:226 (-),score=20.78 TRINITY_DN6261_c0_g1_i1:183-860(-)